MERLTICGLEEQQIYPSGETAVRNIETSRLSADIIGAKPVREGFFFSRRADFIEVPGYEKPFKVVDYGAFFAIRGENGIVSDEYHGFELHELEVQRDATATLNFRVLTGHWGAKKTILRFPTPEKPFFKEIDGTGFNGQIQYRSDLRRLVISNGATQYLLGPDGRVISDGYREFLLRGVYGEKYIDGKYVIERVHLKDQG